MTIEIHQPELEALIQQRMEIGGFQNIEDFLLEALKSVPSPKPAIARDSASKGTGGTYVMPYSTIGVDPSCKLSLEDVFAKVRGLADDLDFSRDQSVGRPVDLS